MNEKYPRDNYFELWQNVRQHHAETFPNRLKLVSIAMVMPYQTADCERGFSAQNRTKTSLRNRLEETTLLRLRDHLSENLTLAELWLNGRVENREGRVFRK